MSPSNLLDLITAYGTRKHCPRDDVRKQYGSHHDQEMHDDLKNLEKQGKIEFVGDEIYLKKSG